MHLKRRPLPSRSVQTMAPRWRQVLNRQWKKLPGRSRHEDHRPAGNLARDEIARLLQLGGMPDIDPAAAEDLRPLGAQDVLRHQDFAIEQEPLLLAVIDDVGADGHFIASRFEPARP